MGLQELQKFILDDSALKDFAGALGCSIESIRAALLKLYDKLKEEDSIKRLSDTEDFRRVLAKQLKDLQKAEQRREVNKRYAHHTDRSKPQSKPANSNQSWLRIRSNPGLR